MVKTKPNEKCPCGSGNKYKKCCLNDDMDKKEQSTIPHVATEDDAIKIKRLSEYYMDQYNSTSIDLSNKVTLSNYRKLLNAHVDTSVFLLILRNEQNSFLFTKFKAEYQSQTMVVYKKMHLCFDYELEYQVAMDQIHKFYIQG